MTSLHNLKLTLTGLILLIIMYSCISVKRDLKYGKAILCGHSDIIKSELQTISVDIIGVEDFSLKMNKSYIQFINKETGDFRFEIELANAQDITLDYYKRLTLFLSPNDSLFIDFGKDFENCPHSETINHIKISGSSAEINSILQKYRSFTEGKNFHPECENKSVEQYKAELSKWIEDRKVSLDSFISQENPSKDFILWAINDNIYSNANYLVDYMFYLDMNKRALKGDLFDKTIFPVDNDPAIISSHYRVHLNQYVQANYCRDSVFIIATKKNDYYTAFNSAINLILKSERSGLSRDIMLCDLLTLCLDKDIEVAKRLKDSYSNQISDTFLRSEFEDYYLKSIEHNSHPIDFRRHFNENDTIIGDLFDDMFSRFKGKVLYIDIWATWCGPCRVELPYFIKLSELYKDEDIEFINICIDSPRESWESFLKTMNYKSNQYYLDKVQSKLLRNKLQIRGIPTYCLINSKGELINKNASRPSSEKIKDEIEVLLKESLLSD